MVGKGQARGKMLRQGASAVSGDRVDHPIDWPPVRVLIADHRPLIRAGIRALLNEAPDLEVAGEVEQAGEVLREARRTKPKVILLDTRVLGEMRVALFRKLFAGIPPVRVIAMLSSHEDGDVAFLRAVEAGVHGYVQADTEGEELIRAIRTVAQGNSYLGPESADSTSWLLRAQQDLVGSSAALLRLSPLERRVIARMAAGNTNKEIAVMLAMSEKTVEHYIANMFAKLEIEHRRQAVALYREAQQQHGSMGKQFPV